MSGSVLDITNAISEFFARMEYLKLRRSELDIQINDYTHWLELLDLNAIDISRITKLLKEAYRERRRIKEEFHMCHLFSEKYLNKKCMTGPIDLSEIVVRSAERVESYKQIAMESFKKFQEQSVRNS